MVPVITPNLHEGDAEEHLDRLRRHNVQFDLIHVDPPWDYQAGRGSAAKLRYACWSDVQVVAFLRKLWHVAKPDSYMIVWCTHPKMFEFALAFEKGMRGLSKANRWHYKSGGSLHKRGKCPGIGYHWLGDSEGILLFVKGSPKPECRISNAFRSARLAHSQKPVGVIGELYRAFSPLRGTVFDPMMGLGTSAVAAMQTGREFYGVEIDPRRCKQARYLVNIERESTHIRDAVSVPRLPNL